MVGGLLTNSAMPLLSSPISHVVSNGEPTLRLFSRSTAETPNRYSVEFQDEFNEYQQDSLSLVDVADAVAAGQEITASLTALGLPNFSQAGRVLRLQLDRAIRGNTFVEFETGVRGIGLRPGDLITLTYFKEGLVRQLFRIVRMAPGLNYRSISITAQVHNDEWYTGSGASLGVIGGGRQPSVESGLPRPLAGTQFDDEGFPQFEIMETPIETADGSYEVSLSVSFGQPVSPAKNAPPIPLMSLAPDVTQGAGTLKGGRSYYYAISGVSADGLESPLSFVARATAASDSDSNSVTLHDLSFAPATTSFNVYRGPNPTQLLRIAKEQPVAAEWIDTGADSELVRRRTPTITTRISTGGWSCFPRPTRQHTPRTALVIVACECCPMSIAGRRSESAMGKEGGRSGPFLRMTKARWTWQRSGQ